MTEKELDALNSRVSEGEAIRRSIENIKKLSSAVTDSRDIKVKIEYRPVGYNSWQETTLDAVIGEEVLEYLSIALKTKLAEFEEKFAKL